MRQTRTTGDVTSQRERSFGIDRQPAATITTLLDPGRARRARLAAADGPLRLLTYRGLQLLVFTLPWQGAQYVGGSTITRVVGVVLLPLAGLAVLREGQRHELRETHWLALAYVAWVAFSAFWSRDLEATVAATVTFVQLAALLLLLWEFAAGRRLPGILWSYLAGAAVVMVDVIGDWLANPGQARYRATGTNPNYVGLLMAFAVMVAWFLASRSERPSSRVVARVGVAAATFVSVLTASRGGLVLLVVSYAFILVTMGGLSFATQWSFAALAAVALVFGAAALPAEQVERLSTTTSEVSEGSLNGRRELWDVAWGLFDDSPVVGVGADAPREEIRRTFGEENAVHNTYLENLAGLGVVGMFFFAAMFASALLSMAAAPLERRFGYAIVAMLAVAFLVTHLADDKVTWLALGTVIGLARQVPE